MFKLK